MNPNIGEYDSYMGVDMVHFALVTQDDAAAYTAEIPQVLAPATEIAVEAENSQKTQYANNKPRKVLRGEGVTKVMVSTTNIPVPILALLLGKKFDTVTGRMFDQGGLAHPPDVALSFRALKTNDKNRYWQYLKGTFSIPKEEATTKTDSPDAKPAQIEYAAVLTEHEFTYDGETIPYKKVNGDEDTDNFDGTTWFDAVQVPGYTAPDALTLTPVPAKNATGISKSTAFTLTFNNQMMADVINSITLLDATPAVVTTAATLDATKKIVTVTHTAMAGTTAHTIVISGATDIHGQTLSDIVKFTTAA